MAAPYGNRNAEKWTFKKSVRLFQDAIELSNQLEDDCYKFDFIGEIARELGTFHHMFMHLVKRFPSLKRQHDQLLNNLESNCYYNTKKGKIREATGIVNLKSNHHWTDRNETHNTGEIKIEWNETHD